MREVTTNNFGLLIAYLLPGLTCLWAVSYHWEPVRNWLVSSPQSQPTVAGFLYLTFGAVAAGMAASTARWGLIDTLHHFTGVKRPQWNYSQLQQNLAAFSLIVEHHYRYYQHYGGMVIALLCVLISRLGGGALQRGWLDLALVIAIGAYFIASRDTLKKYYRRCDQFMNAG